MLYFALLLIFAGLACLLYLFVVFFLSGSAGSNQKGKMPPDLQRSGIPAKESGQIRSQVNGSLQSPEKQQVSVRKPAPARKDEAPTQDLDSESVERQRKFKLPPTVKQSETQSERIVSQNLMESVQHADSSTEYSESKVTSPVIYGVLYHDQHRRCIQAVDHWKEVPVDFFEELRRIGPGILHYEDGSFRVETDDQNVRYDIGDMEQILFRDGGLALIPSGRKAAGVFLTKDSRKLKNFLAENSL